MAGLPPAVDAASFAAFVQRHRAELVRAASRIAVDSAEAEDVVQDTLMAIWRRWQHRPPDDPSAYAFRAVTLNAIKRRHAPASGDAPGGGKRGAGGTDACGRIAESAGIGAGHRPIAAGAADHRKDAILSGTIVGPDRPELVDFIQHGCQPLSLRAGGASTNVKQLTAFRRGWKGRSLWKRKRIRGLNLAPGAQLAIAALFAGVAIAIGVPAVVLGLGRQLTPQMQLWLVVFAVCVGGLTTLTAAFFGTVIPSSVGGEWDPQPHARRHHARGLVMPSSPEAETHPPCETGGIDESKTEAAK